MAEVLTHRQNMEQSVLPQTGRIPNVQPSETRAKTENERSDSLDSDSTVNELMIRRIIEALTGGE
jgi:hypothetical protein